MRRITSVLAVAALLAAMLIGAPVALAQEEPPEEETCVLVVFSPGQSGTGEATSVSVKNADRFAAKHGGTVIPFEHPCPAEPAPEPI